MKTYSAAPDADSCIAKIQAAHHPDLKGVTVMALFAFDSDSEDPVLEHQGYPAGAVCRITSLRDRASGMTDASIVVDRSTWLDLSQPQRDALIDHELTHLKWVYDQKTGKRRSDSLGRPKLKMRKHDHQFGWFDDVAKRHGQASHEVMQARALMATAGQLYFDFEPRKRAA